MKMELVEIKTLITEGYERTAQVFIPGKNGSVWCHFIQHDEYIEAGNESAKLKTGDRIEGKFSIQLVTGFTLLDNGEAPGFTQPINESPHIVATGKVKEIIDEYSCLCDFGWLGEAIPVEFEDSVTIEPGSVIQVRGSLELENVQSSGG
jgi:hypothetical protein